MTAVENVTDPKALQSIMLSLQRLIKIGIYYPPGHSALERAVEQFRQNLVKVAGDAPTIRFSIREENLYLQDILLDNRYLFSGEFQETLAGLAIKNLDIDREISADEIQRFIKSLLNYRTKYKAIKGFAQISLEDFPFSVRISQDEYLAPEIDGTGAGNPTDPARPSLEVLLESLAAHDLSSRQLEQCRHLLESISLQPMQAVSKAGSSSPLITWADVERLIINLVKKPENKQDTESTKSRQDLDALASILGSIGEKTTSNSSREAIKLLVSLVKKSAQPSPSSSTGTDPAPGEATAESSKIAAIKRYIEEQEQPRSLSTGLLGNDNRETLTIILLLLQYNRPLQVQYRMQQMLREILADDLKKKDWKVLAGGVLHLINAVDKARLTVIMPMITDPLRRSEHSSSLSLFEQVSSQSSHDQLKKVLPYILNELLVVGRLDNPDAFDRLCNKILYLPRSDTQTAYSALSKLDAFQEDNVAQDLFFSQPKDYYPVFAPLMNSPLGTTVHRRIFHAFKTSIPDWLIEALLPFLKTPSSLNKEFFVEYLMASGRPGATSKIRSLAGEIITDGLPALSEEERQSPDLIKTINAIPRLKDDRLHAVLESIISQKHYLIIPQWPLHCRKAAREALSMTAMSGDSR